MSRIDWNVNQFVQRVKVWPWKPMGWVFAGSFLTASIVSSVVARVIVPAAPESVSIAGAPEQVQVTFGRTSPTLSESAINAILQRNLFNSEGTTEDKNKSDGKSEVVRTDLPIKLVGTIYGGTPFNGIAVIETENKANTFLTGDLILGEATLAEIHDGRIILEREGRREYADIEQQEVMRTSRQKKKPKAPPGGGFVDSVAPLAVDPPPPNFKEDGFERKGEDMVATTTYRDRMLGPEMAKVLQDAKAVPNMVNGQLKGFKLERIRKDSVYEKMGFMNQDVIEEINGFPLTDTAGALKFLNTLRAEKEVEIRVRRGGSVVNKLVRLQ